MTELVLLLIQL